MVSLRKLAQTPRRVRRWIRIGFALSACAAVVTLVHWVRSTGGLQSLEMLWLDQLYRTRSSWQAAPSSPVVIVGMTEEDLDGALAQPDPLNPGMKIGRYPIGDAELADLVDRCFALGAACVGIDVYRDVPVYEGREKLAACFKRHGERLQSILLIGSDDKDRRADGKASMKVIVREPEAAELEQIAFNNLLTSAEDPTPRRAALTLDTGEGNVELRSLGLAVAEVYARRVLGAPAFPLDKPFNDRVWGATRWTVLQPGRNGMFFGRFGSDVLMDYRGPPQFTTYTLTQLTELRPPPEGTPLLKDAIVLIGARMPSTKDYYPTPLGRRYGVEIHGLIADQLVRGLRRDVQPVMPSPFVDITWSVFWTLAGIGIAFAVSGPFALLLLLTVASCLLGASSVGLFAIDVYTPVVPALLCMSIGSGIVLGLTLALEGERRKAMTDVFQRVVDPAVMPEIIRHQDEIFSGRSIPGQDRYSTVLFTDLRNFTSFCESRSASASIEFLNRYLARVRDAIHSQKGMVSKYIGDSVMAVFGAPLSRETVQDQADDAARAVAAALAIREIMRSMASDLEVEEFDLATRVGIHSGWLSAGAVGDAQRFEYTVIGDTVNVASRLESYDKELMGPVHADGRCRILISGVTAELLAGRFRLEAIGSIRLKGKDEPVQVYSVLGTSAGAAGPNSRSKTQETPAAASGAHA
jgi:adenylate cyclase